MYSPRLLARVPSARFIRLAYLSGFKLGFNKRSARDNSGKCGVYFTGNPSDVVKGVLFEIDDSEKKELDRAEGEGRGYDSEQVHLQTDQGLVEAFAYIGDPIYTVPDLRPFKWYMEFIVKGAEEHGIEKAYVEKLESVPTQMDPNPERESQERR